MATRKLCGAFIEEYAGSPESVRGNGTAEDMERVIRQIRQVHKRLAQIETEIAGLVDSEIAKLKAKTEEATSFIGTKAPTAFQVSDCA